MATSVFLFYLSKTLNFHVEGQRKITCMSKIMVLQAAQVCVHWGISTDVSLIIHTVRFSACEVIWAPQTEQTLKLLNCTKHVHVSNPVTLYFAGCISFASDDRDAAKRFN